MFVIGWIKEDVVTDDAVSPDNTQQKSLPPAQASSQLQEHVALQVISITVQCKCSCSGRELTFVSLGTVDYDSLFLDR